MYRLLPRRVFLEQLPAWERPALTLLHLRREVLGLQCAAAPAMANPPQLLAKCMSAPEPTTATDALAFLAGTGAVEVAAKDGYSATRLGRFLAHLPVSMEAALLLERGGKAGVLREACALAALLNTSPLPIRQPFSQREAFRQNLQRCVRAALCWKRGWWWRAHARVAAGAALRSDPCLSPSVPALQVQARCRARRPAGGDPGQPGSPAVLGERLAGPAARAPPAGARWHAGTPQLRRRQRRS